MWHWDAHQVPPGRRIKPEGGSELGLEPRQRGPTAEHTALGAGPRLWVPCRVPEDELSAPAGGPRAGIGRSPAQTSSRAPANSSPGVTAPDVVNTRVH